MRMHSDFFVSFSLKRSHAHGACLSAIDFQYRMASLSELYRNVHQYSRDILRRRCGRAFQSEQYSALLIELHPRLSCSQRRKESLGGISRATCDLTVPHLPTPPATSATDSSQYQATAAQYIRSVPMRVQGYYLWSARPATALHYANECAVHWRARSVQPC